MTGNLIMCCVCIVCTYVATAMGSRSGTVFTVLAVCGNMYRLYQNAEAFPLPIGLSRAVQCD